MKFCANCGTAISEGAVVCTACGHAVPNVNLSTSGAWSTGAMVGLVIGSLLFPIVGVGFGLWGRSQPGKRDQATILLIIGMVAWFGACLMLSSF